MSVLNSVVLIFASLAPTDREGRSGTRMAFCWAGYPIFVVLGGSPSLDNDGRWASPPTKGKPTIVKCSILIFQLQNLDTVRGTLDVRIGVWCRWTDSRLKGRGRMDPLPKDLWSPGVSIQESLGDFVCRTSEFQISIGSLEGKVETHTMYEGTIENEQDLSIFPFETDTVVLNFAADKCYLKNGETNANYKTEFRLLFKGWAFDVAPGPNVAPYGWELVSTVVEPLGQEGFHDIIQIKLNMKRKIGFYLCKVVLPLILITCLNFMGFFLEEFPDRLANNVSLFLAAQALLYVVGSELPRGTFNTAIDRIVLITLTLIFATSIHFAVLWRLDKRDQFAEQMDDPKNVQNSPNVQREKDKVESHEITVLTYLSIYFAYLIVEGFRLMILRMRSCSHFKKNIGQGQKEFADENVWLNGVWEFNAAVEADPLFQIPWWLIVDPFDITLVKKGDPRTLFLPALEVDVPTKLILPSGKAVVMSSKPAMEVEGNVIKWMTLGSPNRALEVMLGTDNRIKVGSDWILSIYELCLRIFAK